jgi:hypothetical protein
VDVGPAMPAGVSLVVSPLAPLARLAAAAAASAVAELAGSAAAAASIAAAVRDLPGPPAVAVAEAAAVGMAAAAGLAAVLGGADPGSRQGARGPWAGAGSQSCTMESCIFVMRCALLCSY